MQKPTRLSGFAGLVAQWHPTKNGDLTPESVGIASQEKVWWLCDFGHEWQALVFPRTKGVGCPVCVGKKTLPGFNDMATTHPELAAQWHPTKNGSLTPVDVVAGTNRPLWWVCNLGHEWVSPGSRRKGGAGCPYCAGQKVLPGFNDMATTHPELAAQWHPTKNGSLTPESLVAHTSVKVWWVCNLGHEWQVVGNNRARGAGCPFCSGRKTLPGFNDMATTHPALAAQWHPTKNGELTPDLIQAGSRVRVWWVCELEHEWPAMASDRLVGRGCPYCTGRLVLAGFNDMATTHPHLLAHWHPTKNGELTPDLIQAWTGKRIWWRCEKGHEWRASGASKASGVNCPTCWGRTVLLGFNDMATTHPALVAQWHPTKNGDLTPEKITASANRKFWWICELGHEWPALASNRASGRGCPTCAVGGFDPSKPSALYFIAHRHYAARKVGITNLGTTRLQDFAKAGWEVLDLVTSDDGFVVQEVETTILRWIRKNLGLPQFLGPEEMRGVGGWTETFSEEGPSNLEVTQRIQREFLDRGCEPSARSIGR